MGNNIVNDVTTEENFSVIMSIITATKIEIDNTVNKLKENIPEVNRRSLMEDLKMLIAKANTNIAIAMSMNVSEELMQIQLSPLMLYMHDIMQFSIFRDINTKINLYKFEILVRATDRNRNLTTYCLDSSIEEASQKVLESYQNVSILHSELIAQVNQELPSSVLTDLIL